MATLFGSASTPAHDGSDAASPIAVAPPGSMVAGQLVYVGITTKNDDSGVTISNAGGQTWIDEGVFSTSTNRSIHVFWCIFDGTWDANPAWAVAGVSNALSALMRVWTPTSGYAFDPANLDAEIVQTNGSAPSTPFDFTVTGVNRTEARTIAAGFAMSVDDNELQVQTAGWGYLSVDNIAGTDMATVAFDQAFTSAGSTGDIVIRQTANGGNTWMAVVMAFKETAAGSVFNHLVQAGLTLTAAVRRRTKARMAVAATFTPIVRRYSRVRRAVTATLAPAVRRRSEVLQSIGITLTAAVRRRSHVLRAVGVTLAPAATGIRLFTKAVSVGLTLAPALQRRVLHRSSIVVTFTAAVSRRVAHRISIALTLTPALRRHVARVVSVALSLGAAVRRTVAHRTSTALSLGVAIRRAVAHRAAVALNLALQIPRRIGHRSAVGVSLVADASGQLLVGLIQKVVSVGLTLQPTTRRAVHVVRRVTLTLSTSVTRAVAVTLQTALALVALATKRLRYTASVVMSLVSNTSWVTSIASTLRNVVGTIVRRVRVVGSLTRRAGSTVSAASRPTGTTA